MKNVRIGFSTSQALISRIIRFFTRGKASHAFFIVDADAWPIVIGADWNGVVAQGYRRFIERNRVLACYSSEDLDFDLDKGIEFLMQRLDVGYDYLGLFGMLFVILASWLGFNVRNPWGSPYKQFCSEAAAEMLQSIGFPDAEYLDPRSIEPNELWYFLDERADEVNSETRKREREIFYAAERAARSWVRN